MGSWEYVLPLSLPSCIILFISLPLFFPSFSPPLPPSAWEALPPIILTLSQCHASFRSQFVEPSSEGLIINPPPSPYQGTRLGGLLTV